jgi:ParB-like chromosome segregation protein Spo0J
MAAKLEKRASATKVYDIPIRQINKNTNPRNPLSKDLERMGWDCLNGDKQIWRLATSDDAEERAQYVKLVQNHDPELAALAATILTQGLLEPVECREGGTGTYTLCFGARRCLAILFNWCMLGKPKEPYVQATLVKGNEATLLHRALIENIRKPQSKIEEARAIQMALNAGEEKEEVARQLKKIHEGKSVKSVKAEANGHAETPKPRLRSRKEIEAAAEEYVAGTAERRVFDWLLCRTEKIR